MVIRAPFIYPRRKSGVRHHVEHNPNQPQSIQRLRTALKLDARLHGGPPLDPLRVQIMGAGLLLCLLTKGSVSTGSECPGGDGLMGRSLELNFVSDAIDHKYSVLVGSHMTQTDTTEGTTRSLGHFSGISGGVHHFSAGDACESGHQSADITFRCGSKDNVVSAEGASTCQFSFVIETPLCCTGERRQLRAFPPAWPQRLAPRPRMSPWLCQARSVQPPLSTRTRHVRN